MAPSATNDPFVNSIWSSPFYALIVAMPPTSSMKEPSFKLYQCRSLQRGNHHELVEKHRQVGFPLGRMQRDSNSFESLHMLGDVEVAMDLQIPKIPQ